MWYGVYSDLCTGADRFVKKLKRTVKIRKVVGKILSKLREYEHIWELHCCPPEGIHLSNELL